MRKNYLLLLLLPNIIIAQTTAATLQVHDTRDSNNPPSAYQNEIRAEFKARGVLGVPGEGFYSGNLTFAPWSDNSGGKNHQLNFNNGGLFYRNGASVGAWESWKTIWHSGNLNNTNSDFNAKVINASVLSSNNNTAEGGFLSLNNETKTGSTNSIWRIYNMTGAYGNSLQFWGYSADNSNSGVRLKISDTGDMALPHGKFEAQEVKVTTIPTADFVFEEDYNLPTLEDVEKHIKEKKHLPEIASAKEMEKEGVNIGEFQIKLLQKIEELTLYTIEQNKQNKEQQNQIQTLQSENKDFKSLLKRVEKLEKSAKN